jgi:phosphoribosyl 1,2-cyclic phosphodiesterase
VPFSGSLKFLGTAGARFAVSTQLRHSGGLLWTLGDTTLWVDPGPGALVRALASRPKVDPSRVDALLLTHAHLDHVGDATAVVEAMTRGGFTRRGTLLAPRSALEGEPVVFRYAQGFVERREILVPGGRYVLGPGVTLETPLAHDHGVETYGYRLACHDPSTGAGPAFRAAHVVDTYWMEELAGAYAGVDLLLVNTTRQHGRERRYLHLGLDDAEALVLAVRPRLAVLTHFGMQLPPQKAEAAALSISERTGVPVVAARDGWRLALPELPALRRPAPGGAGEAAERPSGPAR